MGGNHKSSQVRNTTTSLHRRQNKLNTHATPNRRLSPFGSNCRAVFFKGASKFDLRACICRNREPARHNTDDKRLEPSESNRNGDLTKTDFTPHVTTHKSERQHTRVDQGHETTEGTGGANATDLPVHAPHNEHSMFAHRLHWHITLTGDTVSITHSRTSRVLRPKYASTRGGRHVFITHTLKVYVKFSRAHLHF